MKEGWICLHRQIMEHWIWTDPIKLKWWMYILLSVNHEDTKVNVGMQIYDCEAGQSIRSLSSWAKSFGCSKDTVRNFFRLLESDKMIKRETIGKSTRSTTRLTVCNYGRYQGRPFKKQNKGSKESDPNNNDNNVTIKENRKKRPSLSLTIEERKDFLIEQMKPYRDIYGPEMLNEFFSYWTELNTNGTMMRFEMERTWETKRRLERWNRNNTK